MMIIFSLTMESVDTSVQCITNVIFAWPDLADINNYFCRPQRVNLFTKYFLTFKCVSPSNYFRSYLNCYCVLYVMLARVSIPG